MQQLLQIYQNTGHRINADISEASNWHERMSDANIIHKWLEYNPQTDMQQISPMYK